MSFIREIRRRRKKLERMSMSNEIRNKHVFGARLLTKRLSIHNYVYKDWKLAKVLILQEISCAFWPEIEKYSDENLRKEIQWNLSIADMLYSGHLSIADTFPKNG